MKEWLICPNCLSMVEAAKDQLGAYGYCEGCDRHVHVPNHIAS